MSIGKRLRKIRSEQGMTVKDLSEKSGVPEKTIYRIETGEVQDPKISSIEPLIGALNCSADELLFDVEKFHAAPRLRQLFANLSQMEEHDLEIIMEVMRRYSLAQAIERNVKLARIDDDNEG